MSNTSIFEIQRKLEEINYPTPLPLAKDILEFTNAKEKEIAKILERISNNEPWEYIKGHTYFKGYKIFVNKNVLIPRIETEELVDIATEKIKEGSQILDIGTGSGCIAIALSKVFPENEVLATDISKKALTIAKKNIDLNNCKNIKVFNANLLNFPFDNKTPTIIVANLPYLPSKNIGQLDSSVKDFEPTMALDGGVDGNNFYNKLMVEIKEKGLNLNYAIFEIGPSIKEYFKKFEIRKDCYGQERFVIIPQTLLKQL